jgi:hypothetical protein
VSVKDAKNEISEEVLAALVAAWYRSALSDEEIGRRAEEIGLDEANPSIGPTFRQLLDRVRAGPGPKQTSRRKAKR